MSSENKPRPHYSVFNTRGFRCVFGHSIVAPLELIKYNEWREWALGAALRLSNGDVRKASKLMGVGRSTVQRWMKEKKK